jgi:uncharacterized C2H2 Zn-finger protein
LNTIIAYILTGLLFSFPFLSPASGFNVIPSLQIEYLNTLQASENKHKSSGSDNNEKTTPSQEKAIAKKHFGSFAGCKVVGKVIKSTKDKVWSYINSADGVLQNRGAIVIKRVSTHHKYNTLLSVRTIVLRI